MERRHEMTTDKFRVKYEHDPTSLWRDIHLWFSGTDQDYWNSDVQYKRSDEMEQSTSGTSRSSEEYDAGETTISQMAQQLDPEERDRMCYLFDYGDEWRFYAILEEINEDEPSDTEPAVVKKKGDPAEQYAPSG